MYYLTMAQDEVSFRISSSGKPNNLEVNEAIKSILPEEWTQTLIEQTTQIRALIQARSLHLARCKQAFAELVPKLEEKYPELFL